MQTLAFIICIVLALGSAIAAIAAFQVYFWLNEPSSLFALILAALCTFLMCWAAFHCAPFDVHFVVSNRSA